jgi:shikimate dehydrogenase
MRITGSTRVFALLGNPVSHSFSPIMQNLAFRVAGLDAVYVAIRCNSTDLPGVIRSLVIQGGGGNVTLPHKPAAALVGTPDGRVSALGVANVFGGRDGKTVVGNTDVDGFLALLKELEAPSTAWRVLGTGGSARAAVAAAAEMGAKVSVQSRSEERHEEFSRWAATLGVRPAEPEECEVLVNATPIGLSVDDPIPVELATLPSLRVVADLTYQDSGPTALVKAAALAGLNAADGRKMLLVQGAAAWQYWFPGVEVPLEAMRAALKAGIV